MSAIGYTTGDSRKVDVGGDTITGDIVLSGSGTDLTVGGATSLVNITVSGSGTVTGTWKAGKLSSGVTTPAYPLDVNSTGQTANIKSTAAVDGLHALTVYQATTTAGENCVAGNFASDNPLGSCVYMTGVNTQRGVLKISHDGTGTDTTASALAIDLRGVGTACQGIALVTTNPTTGNLILMRNNARDDFVVKGDGTVGIRVAQAHTPTGALEVSQADDATVGLAMTANSSSAQQMVLLKDSGGASRFEITAAGNSVHRATAFFTGSVQIGSASSDLGGGTGVISIKNRGTAPTTNPTGGGILYTENGALMFRGSSGTVTTVAPA